MKFIALVPQREANVQTLLGDILKLPSINEGISSLDAEIKAERPMDLPIEFNKMSMMDDGGFVVDGLDGVALQYTRHALTQAVVRIKPEDVIGMAGYLAVCPPDLRSINFNYWHQDRYGPHVDDYPKNDVSLRTRMGEAGMPIMKAVVSQSYVPIDDLPLLKQFDSIVPEGAKIRSARGDVKSRYDVIWPTMKKTVVNGEPIVVMVRLSNSEAGTSSVRLEPMVYGLNLRASIMIPTYTPDVSIRHIGEASKRLGKRLEYVFQTIDPFIEMLSASYTDSIIGHFNDLDVMFDAMKKAFEFNEKTVTIIKDCMFKKETRAHLIEAISRAANELPIEDGEYLQKCAGQLASNGWRTLTRYVTAE